MIRKVLTVSLVVLVLAVTVGFVVGIGPAPGGDDGTDIESFPTETPGSGGGAEAETDAGSTGDGGGDATGVAATTTSGPPFLFTIEGVERCGQTCRDVTTTLTNEQSTAASDVQVYTRVYVGNGTDGDPVWSGTESVGHLDAGESYTATNRVELSVADAYAVQRHDGWITVQTTVESDGETMTFTQRRDVA